MDVGRFWKILDQELDYRGYTKKDLCTLCGINYGTFRNQASFNKAPDVETIEKIGKFLNLNVAELILEITPTVELTDYEKNMLYSFRSLSKEDQNTIVNVIKAMAKKK